MVAEIVDAVLDRLDSWKNMDMPSFDFAFADTGAAPVDVAVDELGVLGVFVKGVEDARAQS